MTDTAANTSTDSMLARLKRIEREQLPALLREPADRWRSLDVIYHPPRVERVWRQLGPDRLFLHRIWPCDPGASLLHPHDWPSAIRLLTGVYEHGVAVAAERGPRTLVTTELAAGSCYEMSEPKAWHYVRPLGGPALSLMLTGSPYPRPLRERIAKPERPQPPLPDANKRELLRLFRDLYPTHETM